MPNATGNRNRSIDELGPEQPPYAPGAADTQQNPPQQTGLDWDSAYSNSEGKVFSPFFPNAKESYPMVGKFVDSRPREARSRAGEVFHVIDIEVYEVGGAPIAPLVYAYPLNDSKVKKLVDFAKAGGSPDLKGRFVRIVRYEYRHERLKKIVPGYNFYPTSPPIAPPTASPANDDTMQPGGLLNKFREKDAGFIEDDKPDF